MTLILMTSCFMSPVEIAFSPLVIGGKLSGPQVFEIIMDFLFFIDLVLTFNVAILN